MGLLDSNQGDGGGIFSGLLSLFKPTDIGAEYGRPIIDPATGKTDPAVADAFRSRALAAAAGAFAEGAMPVPYKGGIPLGATIGRAGAAAATAGDTLMDARLKNAQQTLALANAGNAQAQALARRAFAEGYGKDPDQAGGGPGTGKGGASVAGGPVTGAAKILANQGGINPTQLYSFLTDNGASKNEATMLTSAANSESSFRPDLTHDGGIGYGLFGHNTDRLQNMYQFAGLDPKSPVGTPIPWQQQALYALQELRSGGPLERRAGAMVNAATTPEQLTDAQLQFERPDLKIAGGNRAQRLASTTEYWNKSPYAPTTPEEFAGGALRPTQVASAGPAGAPGPAGPPMAPPQASTGLLSDPAPVAGDFAPVAGPNAGKVDQARLDAANAAWGGRNPGGRPPPDPTSAAPPSLLAPPPAAPPVAPPPASPGPGAGLPPGGPQLASLPPATMNDATSPAAQLMPGAQPGLLAQAGPGGSAVPPPSAAPDMPVPHTGAAGAAELQGLLNQPPAGPPPVPAPAPPAGGPPGPVAPPPVPQGPPGPPVPAPAPGPPPAQRPPPPAPPPAMPPELGQTQISNAKIKWAHQMVGLAIAGGLPVPPDLAAIASLPVDLAKQEQAARLKGFYDQQQELYKKQLEIWGAGPIAQAGIAGKVERVAPGGGVSIGGQPPAFYAPERMTLRAPDGTYHDYFVSKPTTPGGQPTYTYIGPAKPSEQQSAYGTGVGTAQAGNTPLSTPQTAPPGQPGAPQYPGTPLAPGMNSKMPSYQEPTYTGDQLKVYQPEWVKRGAELTEGIGAAQAAELRLQDIANAFKEIQTGRWTTDKSAFNAAMTSIFGKDAPFQFTNASPAEVEKALHANYRATLQTLSEVNKRFTNNEFRVTSETSESPNLQPEANLQMLSQDIAQLRQLKGLGHDWVQARIEGKQDPTIFASKWLTDNPLKPIADGVEKEIGPLRGMGGGQSGPAIPGDLPQGTQYLGTAGGRPVYKLPNGSQVTK